MRGFGGLPGIRGEFDEFRAAARIGVFWETGYNTMNIRCKIMKCTGLIKHIWDFQYTWISLFKTWWWTSGGRSHLFQKNLRTGNDFTLKSSPDVLEPHLQKYPHPHVSSVVHSPTMFDDTDPSAATVHGQFGLDKVLQHRAAIFLYSALALTGLLVIAAKVVSFARFLLSAFVLPGTPVSPLPHPILPPHSNRPSSAPSAPKAAGRSSRAPRMASAKSSRSSSPRPASIRCWYHARPRSWPCSPRKSPAPMPSPHTR
jgi:hypothetical protein